MGLEQLDAFMAAIRRMESGSFQGNYRVVNSIGARGAYQILTGNWASWAAQAGLPGADWRDPRAQDAVARYKMVEYYRKYGSWELVAMAWHGGEGTVQRYLKQGTSALGPNTRSYVSRMPTHFQEALQLYPASASSASPPPGLSADAAERWMQRRQSQAALGATTTPTGPWHYPIYMDPADLLTSILGPTTNEQPARNPNSSASMLSALLSSISAAAKQGSLVGTPADTSQIDLTQQQAPAPAPEES